MKQEFCSRYKDLSIGFEHRYLVYRLCRECGWIPKQGSQYGCDYVLYRDNPDLCHSTYCVNLVQDKNMPSLRAVSGAVRSSEQVRKRMVMCDEQGQFVQLTRWTLKPESRD